MKIDHLVSALIFAFIAQTSAHAVDVQLHGFGTAGVAKSDSRYPVNDIGNDGPRPIFERDTRFGLNVSAKLSDRWDMSSQFITKANSHEPITAQYFFARLQATSQLAIRAGRLLAPTWLFSEQIEVGLTYPWIRLPYEVYNLNPLRFYDGLSIAWNQSLGDWSMILEVEGGTSCYKQQNFNQTLLNAVTMPEMVGANLTFTDDKHVMVRASYATALINGILTLTSVGATVTPGTVVNTITTTTTMNAERGHLISVGGKFEFANFLLITEAARRIITGNYLSTGNAAYGTLGYRFGDFMPFASVSWQGNLTGTGWVDPEATPTNILSLLDNQMTISGGVNYRFSPSIVWKLQYDNVRTNNMTAALSKTANVVSTSLDFVF